MARLKSLSALEEQLTHEAERTARTLLRLDLVLVLAESCTAGLIAASLARTPGVSRVLAGSFVIYQIDSKRRWLGIPASRFRNAPDGVSSEITEHLVEAALRKTPHAEWAGAITGRLGPSSNPNPQAPDGEAWISLQHRNGKPVTRRVQLLMQDPSLAARKAAQDPIELRRKRQVLASIQFFRMVRLLLRRPPARRTVPARLRGSA